MTGPNDRGRMPPLSTERRRRHTATVEKKRWRHETQPGYTSTQPLNCPENRDCFRLWRPSHEQRVLFTLENNHISQAP